jgi:hypothetical protein
MLWLKAMITSVIKNIKNSDQTSNTTSQNTQHKQYTNHITLFSYRHSHTRKNTRKRRQISNRKSNNRNQNQNLVYQPDFNIKLLKPVLEDPILKPYYRTNAQFIHYIASTKHSTLRIRTFKFNTYNSPQFIENEQESTTTIPYIHRWTSQYRRKYLAKLYQLEQWYKKQASITGETQPITMLTLTTYQAGEYSKSMKHGQPTSIEESFKLLKNGWKWLSMIIRKELKYSPNYITILEPHESGYPHMHIPIFCTIPPELQTKIQKLWQHKYKIGSAKHGVNFSVSEPKTGIQSIRNYLMKYMAKGFITTKSKFNTNTPAKISPAELTFNALLWKSKTRMFGASRALSHVMKHKKTDPWTQFRPINEHKDIENNPTNSQWLSTELITQNNDAITIRTSPLYKKLVNANIIESNEKIENRTSGFSAIISTITTIVTNILPTIPKHSSQIPITQFFSQNKRPI